LKFFKYLTLLGLFVASQAFALKADLESVKAYHQDEIQQLLKDYTLEDSLNIRVELKRKDAKLSEEEVVNIPGLYQKTGEFNEADLGKVLNLYERKVVLIKKRIISDEELNLVRTSLNDRLYLPEDVSYTMLDDVPKVSEAVSNLGNDFVFGAYATLVKKGQFLWIIIFSLGFILALWILAKVWKSKSESAGGASELSMSGAGAGDTAKDNSSSKDDDYSYANASGSSDSDLETFNFRSLCSNLLEAHSQAPGSTAQVLWAQIPDFKSQLQFCEIIKIQKDIPEQAHTILDSVFSFKSRSGNTSAQRSKGFNKNTLSNISVELAKIKFSDAHQQVEKVLSEIYPNCADHTSELYSKGMENHYLVLYKIFKDDFMNHMSSDASGSILGKINDLLTFDPETDHPSDSEYQAFNSFLKESKFGGKIEGQKSVNNKVVQMLYKLSEADLENVKALKESDELKAMVPRVSWVKSEDAGTLKSFLTNLDSNELQLFLVDNDSFSSAISALDDRTQFRLKEKSNKGDRELIDWSNLRGKIKMFYSYESPTMSEQSDEKKAS